MLDLDLSVGAKGFSRKLTLSNGEKNCEKSFYSSKSSAGRPATEWASCCCGCRCCQPNFNFCRYPKVAIGSASFIQTVFKFTYSVKSVYAVYQIED